MTGHDHDIDGRLHDGCPMCDEIRGRGPTALRERKADEAAERYRKIAERTPTVCNHHWMAPRVEVPDSVDVEHVCKLPIGHYKAAGADPVHVCACKAFLPIDLRPAVEL